MSPGSLKKLAKSKIGEYNRGGDCRTAIWHTICELKDGDDTKIHFPNLSHRKNRACG